MLETIAAGQILLADRAYDGDALRSTLSERGAWANVKPMAPPAWTRASLVSFSDDGLIASCHL